MRKTKMKIKGLTAVLILTFVLICACGKEQGKKWRQLIVRQWKHK